MADDQTLKARAMADVLTGGAGARDGAKRNAGLRFAPTEPPAPAPSTPAGDPPSAAPTASSATPASTEPSAGTVLARGEVDAALADFARLTSALHATFSSSGVVVASVGDGTLFQRAGLRAGDVVASVDGIRLRSLDDAANLYARASTATSLTAQITRAGKPMTLHVAIR